MACDNGNGQFAGSLRDHLLCEGTTTKKKSKSAYGMENDWKAGAQCNIQAVEEVKASFQG